MTILDYIAAALLQLAAPATAGQPTPAAAPPDAVPAEAMPASTVILLRRDTPVELMATREVSTADVAAGTRFNLRVNRAIVIDGRTVVPVGAVAVGEVITASDAGGLGKSGRMTARLLHLQLGDLEVPLVGELSAKGTGAGSAGVAILLSGWAGFFHRGNNAKIKAGETVAGFVRDDVALDLSGPAPRRAAVQP